MKFLTKPSFNNYLLRAYYVLSSILELGDKGPLFGDRLKEKYNAMLPALCEKQAYVDLVQTGELGKEAQRKGKMRKS